MLLQSCITNNKEKKIEFNPEKELLLINNDIEKNNVKRIVRELDGDEYYIKDGSFVKLLIRGTTVEEGYYFNGKNVFAYEYSECDKYKGIVFKAIFYFNNLKITKEKYWWGKNYEQWQLKVSNESVLKQFNITKNDILYQYQEISNKNFVGALTINDLLKDELVTTDKYD